MHEMQKNLKALGDSRTLWFLNRVEERHGLLRQATEARQARQALLRAVVDLAEDGQVAMVNSGMDCDCSRWTNAVSIIDATIEAVEAWVEHFYEWAEGPQSHYIERPSIARTLERSSRDLALEALEDGHPHCINY